MSVFILRTGRSCLFLFQLFCPLVRPLPLEDFQPLWLPLILTARGEGSDGNESRACALNCRGFTAPPVRFWDGKLWLKSQVTLQHLHNLNVCMFSKTQKQPFLASCSYPGSELFGFFPTSLLSSHSFPSPEWCCRQLLCPVPSPASWHLLLNQLFPLAAPDFHLALCFPPCNILPLLWMLQLTG